jgi:hypothetical protein
MTDNNPQTTAPTNWRQRARCRWRKYHTWIDANGDGLTDTCAVCGIGVFDGGR